MLDPEIYKIITHDQYGGYKNFQQIKPNNKYTHHHFNTNNNNNNNNGSSKHKNRKHSNENGHDSGDDNGSVDLKKYTVVYVGDGRSRVRRVVRSHTRHVTVVSYSPRSKETSSHTSHHVTTVSFPQKVNERSAPAYTSHHSTGASSISSAAGVGGGNGGYVYLQQQHYPPAQQQLVYHHHHQIPQYHNHGSAMVTPTLHKKGSIRSGSDVLKRTRGQNAYELSQDLLDKQIELLERKYGGVKARHAALTIQRAFRHYVMVKKFASITAMAKAEKRMSRRMQPAAQTSQDMSGSPYLVDENGQTVTSTYSALDPENTAGQRVCATISATPPGQRVTPVRSMSLRERRNLDSSPIPRSQSGNTTQQPPVSCWTQSPIQHSHHPYVNILHQNQIYYSSPVPSATVVHQHTQHSHYQPQPQLQYQSQYSSQELNMSACSQHDNSGMMNSSWNSHHQSPYADVSQIKPHMPHYSAAQIYMRPRGGTQGSTGSCGSAGSGSGRKVPPEVPKRTSSITPCNTPPNRALRPNGLCKSAENGSLSSVQSSGSDSSASVERMQCELGSDRSNSPQWKRKTSIQPTAQSPDHHMGPVESDCMSSHTSAAQYSIEHHEQLHTPTSYKVSETIRKRQYRVGLNLFNKKPEKGIAYLIRRGFLENTPQGVARFLISRKGLSRQMIGEYLGNLQSQFNMAVLECFAGELDLSGMQVDVALRKFQGYFRMPGEAQKIERLMEIFSQRYSQCNTDIVGRLRSSDTVFVLAFAIIMLNTDLHTPNLKPDRRMRCDDFIKNLRGIDDCHDIDRDMLAGIYERLKTNEFKPGSDHVTQVMKVQATIVGKKPNLALPHRRLVCYCRLYEIPDINKKERPGVHQREVFLFNDLLVITKIFSKKKSSVTYTFRNSYPLCGMVVTLLDVPNYPYCIRLSQKVDNKVLVTFNARNEHDRCKFAEDLRESISEMDEMESLRIEAELDRQKSARGGNRNQSNGNGSGSENRDSGVADVEVCPGTGTYQASSPGGNSGCGGDPHTELKRSALSNSLLDMHEQFGNEKPQRRGSVGSLDSGFSISFQSTSASTGSRSDSKVRMMPTGAGPQYANLAHQQAQMAMYNAGPPVTGAPRRDRKMSRSEDASGAYSNVAPRSTEV